MKLLRKLAGLFMADRLVLAAVPLAALSAWLAAPYLPRPLAPLALLALLAAAFSVGVLRAAHKPVP